MKPPAPSPQGPAPTPLHRATYATGQAGAACGEPAPSYRSWGTMDPSEVTCPKCLAVAAPTPRRPAPPMTPRDVAMEIVAIFDRGVAHGLAISEVERIIERDRLAPVQGEALERIGEENQRLRKGLNDIIDRMSPSWTAEQMEVRKLAEAALALAPAQPPAPPAGTGGTKP